MMRLNLLALVFALSFLPARRAHAGFSAIVDRLACGVLLAPQLSEPQRGRLERWLRTEAAPSLGADLQVVTQPALEPSWSMIGYRFGQTRSRRLVDKILADPAIIEFEFRKNPVPGWSSSLSKSQSLIKELDIALTIFGRDYTWRLGADAPVTGDFVIMVLEHAAYGSHVLPREREDRLPAVIERAQRNANVGQPVRIVTLHPVTDSYQYTYVRIETEGPPSRRLRLTLALMHSIEDELRRTRPGGIP